MNKKEDIDVSLKVDADTKKAEEQYKKLIKLAKDLDYIKNKDKREAQRKKITKEAIELAGSGASAKKIEEYENKIYLEKYKLHLNSKKQTKSVEEKMVAYEKAIEKSTENITNITKAEKKAERARVKTKEKEKAKNKVLGEQALAKEQVGFTASSYKDLISGATGLSELSKIRTKLQNEIIKQGLKGAKVSELRDIMTEQLDPKINEALKLRSERNKAFAEEWKNIISGQKLTKQEKAQIDVKDLRERLLSIREEMYSMSQAGESGSQSYKDLGEQAKGLAKDLKKAEKAAKPSFWQKLVDTFKRIGFYRLARDFFRLMINGFKEGINAITEFDDTARETMEDWNGSMTIIKASMSTILLSIVQMLAPAVRDIATEFAEIANHIAQAVAQMRGLSTYTKINTEYIKELGKQAGFSFDKFETLGQSSEYDGLFSTEDVDETNSNIKAMADILTTIKGVIEIIWKCVSSIVLAVYNLIASKGIEEISDDIETIAGKIKKVIEFLTECVTWITKNIDKALMLGAIIGTIITGIGWATGNIRVLTAGAIMTSSLVAIGLARAYNSAVSVDSVSSKKLTESSLSSVSAIETISGSSPSVGNYSALTSSLTSAIMDASDAGAFDRGDTILNIDGKEVARSKTLKTELNRTNPKLKLV